VGLEMTLALIALTVTKAISAGEHQASSASACFTPLLPSPLPLLGRRVGLFSLSVFIDQPVQLKWL